MKDRRRAFHIYVLRGGLKLEIYFWLLTGLLSGGLWSPWLRFNLFFNIDFGESVSYFSDSRRV